jgi:hypothetical protein
MSGWHPQGKPGRCFWSLGVFVCCSFRWYMSLWHPNCTVCHVLVNQITSPDTFKTFRRLVYYRRMNDTAKHSVRDYQAKRFIAWERDNHGSEGLQRVLDAALSLEACAELMGKVCAAYRIVPPVVTRSSAKVQVCYQGGEDFVRLTEENQTVSGVLHAAAHVVTDAIAHRRQEPVPQHGPLYVRMYSEIVARFGGEGVSRSDLLGSIKAARLDIAPASEAPRQISTESVERFRTSHIEPGKLDTGLSRGRKVKDSTPQHPHLAKRRLRSTM